MKIRNKVREIVCNNCGSNQASLLVSTQKDYFEDCLGLDADGKLTDGMGIEHTLENEVIEQYDGCGDCPCCEDWEREEDGVTLFYEDGTVQDSAMKNVTKYWLMRDDEEEQMKDKEEPKPIVSQPKEMKKHNPKVLPTYR